MEKTTDSRQRNAATALMWIAGGIAVATAILWMGGRIGRPAGTFTGAGAVLTLAFAARRRREAG